MKVDSLFDIVESSIISEEKKYVGKLLLQAISDWPTAIESVDDYLNKVRIFLRVSDLKYDCIKEKLGIIDVESSLWETESLTSLLEIATVNKSRNVDEVLQNYNLI